MKLCGIFGGKYSKYPNLDKTLSGFVSIMLSEIDENGKLTDLAKKQSAHITFTYNQWVVFYKLVGQLEADKKADIARLLKEEAHLLLEGVYQKLAIFKRDDGGFSYNQTTSSPTSQGVPAAVVGSCESDVNATGIATSTLRYVYRVYQLYNDYSSAFTVPYIYTPEDSAYFVSLISSSGLNEKVEESDRMPDVLTFDASVDRVDVGASNGGVLSYYGALSNNVGNTTKDGMGNYLFFRSSISADPENATNKVLKINTYFDETGNASSSNSGTVLKITNSNLDSDTYIFTTKIYLDYYTANQTITQIIFNNSKGDNQTSAKINLKHTSTGLVLEEDSYHKGVNGVSDKYNLDVSSNQWFTLTLRLTKQYSSSSIKSMNMEIQINGYTVKSIDTGRISNGSLMDYDIDSIQLLHYRQSETQIYFDDMYASKVCVVHDYIPVVSVSPTCTEYGLREYMCRHCGHRDEESYPPEQIDFTGHDYSSRTTEPTCIESGYTTYTCSCGHSYIGDEVEAKGHDFTTVNRFPTYTEYICDCGYSYVNQENNHVHKYTATTLEATCTELGYTTYTCLCGDSYTADEIKPLGHSYVDMVVEPNCTDGGYTTRFCHCGASFVDNITEALGHDYVIVITSSTCTESGSEIGTCSHCGDKKVIGRVDPLGHNLENGECTRCDFAESSVNEENFDSEDTGKVTFWQAIANFFKSIGEFFKNLFSKKR